MKKALVILTIVLLTILILTGCMKKQIQEEESQNFGDDVANGVSDLDKLEQDLDSTDLDQFEQDLENFDW